MKTEELERISTLQFLSRLHPGHETLIDKFIQDGTTGIEAVEKLLSSKAKAAGRVVKFTPRRSSRLSANGN